MQRTSETKEYCRRRLSVFWKEGLYKCRAHEAGLERIEWAPASFSVRPEEDDFADAVDAEDDGEDVWRMRRVLRYVLLIGIE